MDLTEKNIIVKKKRIHYIDVMKGIGILLVIIGHTPIHKGFHTILFSFNMPLFFFISGMIFNAEKYNAIKYFITKRIKQLLIPLFIFSLISFIIQFILYYFKIYEITTNEIIKGFISIFYLNTVYLKYIHNQALWFLPTLFITEIYCFLLIKYFKKNNLVLLVMSIIIMTASYLLFYKYLSKYNLPWGVDVALISQFYFIVGYIGRDYINKNRSVIVNTIVLIVTILMILLLYRTVGFRFSMAIKYIPNYFSIFIAFIGIILIAFLSKLISNNRFLIFFGKNTLIILGTHVIVLNFLKYILVKCNLSSIPFQSIITITGCLIIETLIILLYNVYKKDVTPKST